MKVKVVPAEPTRNMIEAAYPIVGGNPTKARAVVRAIFLEMLEHAPPPKRGGLTRNQRRVLEVTAEYIDDHTIAPTSREIAAILGFSDHSTAWRCLRALKRKGIVNMGPGHRHVEILKRPEEV